MRRAGDPRVRDIHAGGELLIRQALRSPSAGFLGSICPAMALALGACDGGSDGDRTEVIEAALPSNFSAEVFWELANEGPAGTVR